MRHIVGLLLLITIINGTSQDSSFPIWGDFSNAYSINHRLNRIGSYITNYEVCNTSATGTGKDSSFYETNYLIAQSKKITTTPGNSTFWLKGKEKDSLFAKQDFSFPDGKDVPFYSVALRGFDIISVQKPTD